MMETYYRFLKHDSKGELIKDSGLHPSRSYVIQFLELIEAFHSNATKDATDTAGAESELLGAANIENYGRLSAAVSDDTFGIVVGVNTGASAEDNEDYALDTKMLHSGVGAADKINYQAVTLIDARVVGANIDLDISRTFLNETGGPLTIKEIGVICKNVSATKYHMLLRDVVADELVADGETLTVVYTLRTTV